MKRKDPIHFFLKPTNPARLRSQNQCHTQGGCGVLVCLAPVAATGSEQDGARMVLDRNQACRQCWRGWRMPGGCLACLKELVLFPWRRKSVTCVSLHLQPPSTDWALALCLWMLSTQPSPSCLLLLFHVSVYFILLSPCLFVRFSSTFH